MAAKLSNADQTYLSPEQQEEIKRLKAEYAAASVLTDPVLRAEAQKEAHRKAEEVRAKAAYGGYSAGTSGTDHTPLAAKQDGTGGQNDQQVKAWLDDYQAAGYDPGRGWVNGYDVDTNTRSKANYVRQQMEANSKAWHGADKETQAYLHDQNVKLADLLAAYTGHDTGGKSYGYDEKTGQWWTWDANNGYGRYVGYEQPNIRSGVKNAYGYTDEQMEDWAKNRSGLYRNFVDARIPARNQMDESGGFTGRYAQFANGPHIALLGTGSNGANMASYSDLVGDGFHDENDYAAAILPEYDEFGNVIKHKPVVKGGNGVSDYTNQFTAYTQNGVIMPNTLQVTNPGSARAANGAYTGAAAVNKFSGLRDNGAVISDGVREGSGVVVQSPVRSRTSGGGSGSAAGRLPADVAALQATYDANLEELNAGEARILDEYAEQKRLAAGYAAQNAAGWRELAGAYGLNSGAVGQAGVAMRNQVQEELVSLGKAQAAAMEEIRRQRATLKREYQMALYAAAEEYDMDLVWALYEDAIKAEEALKKQEAELNFASVLDGRDVLERYWRGAYA